MKTSKMEIRSGDEAGGLKKNLIAASKTAALMVATFATFATFAAFTSPEFLSTVDPDGLREVLSGSLTNLVDGLKELGSSIADPQKAAAQDLLNGGNNGLSY